VIAAEALDRIRALYAVEDQVRGKPRIAAGRFAKSTPPSFWRGCTSGSAPPWQPYQPGLVDEGRC
jgi:hypothetical protein